MSFSNIAATYGLTGRAENQQSGTSGQTSVGGSGRFSLDADVVYSCRALIATGGSLDMALWTANGTATSWSQGTQQVETATAAGTISAAGNVAVVVTAAGMTGSPKTINVAAANGDTAAVWAGKVRTALAADAAVAALFTVGGTTTAISLTRKPTHTFTRGEETVNFYAANDGTLNIALANGTTTGVTTAATSANTTAGVATTGVTVWDADSKDVNGNTINAGGVLGWCIDLASGEVAVTQGTVMADLPMAGPGVIQMVGGGLSNNGLVLEATAGPVDVTVHVAVVN